MRLHLKVSLVAVCAVALVLVLSHAVANVYHHHKRAAPEERGSDAGLFGKKGGTGDMLLHTAEWVEEVEASLLDGFAGLRRNLDDSVPVLEVPHDHQDFHQATQNVPDLHTAPRVTRARTAAGIVAPHGPNGGGGDSSDALLSAVAVVEKNTHVQHHPALFAATVKGAAAHQNSVATTLLRLCSRKDNPDVPAHRLFIIILSSLTVVGAKQRATARETWVGAARDAYPDTELHVRGTPLNACTQTLSLAASDMHHDQTPPPAYACKMQCRCEHTHPQLNAH